MENAAVPGSLEKYAVNAVADEEIGGNPNDPKLGDGILLAEAQQCDKRADHAKRIEQHARRHRLFEVDIGQDAADGARERQRQQIIRRRGMPCERYRRAKTAADSRDRQMRIEIRHPLPPLRQP